MYTHILIATDGSELATKGLDHGLKLARSTGAKVHILTVTDVWSAGTLAAMGPTSIAEYDKAQHEAVTEILKQAAEFAQDSGVPYETQHITDRYPAEAIVETAQKLGCDLIVMATQGRRGVRKMLLGSQTTEVLTSTTIPVLVVR